MKRLRITLVLPGLLIGLLAISIACEKIYASTATSGAFRIDKPVVVIQGGVNAEGSVSIDERGSAEDALEFQKTGVLMQRAAGSGLKATVGMQLIEAEEGSIEGLEIPVYASSNTAYEYIHVRRSEDMHRLVIFNLLSKLDQTGTKDSIDMRFPIELSEKKSFLGTLEVFVGAY